MGNKDAVIIIIYNRSFGSEIVANEGKPFLRYMIYVCAPAFSIPKTNSIYYVKVMAIIYYNAMRNHNGLLGKTQVFFATRLHG